MKARITRMTSMPEQCGLAHIWGLRRSAVFLRTSTFHCLLIKAYLFPNSRIARICINDACFYVSRCTCSMVSWSLRFFLATLKIYCVVLCNVNYLTESCLFFFSNCTQSLLLRFPSKIHPKYGNSSRLVFICTYSSFYVYWWLRVNGVNQYDMRSSFLS